MIGASGQLLMPLQTIQINSAQCQLVNYGVARFEYLNINTDAGTNCVCLGSSACIVAGRINNNSDNAITAPSGGASLTYTGATLTLNAPLTASSDLDICVKPSSTFPTSFPESGGVGSANLINPCITDCFTSSVLPVDFVYFKSNVLNENVLLKWATSSEENNSHYEIERSFDGKEFTKVGEEKAKSQSSSDQLNYHFLDHHVSVGETYYYRLKQVDLDGKYSYTNVISQQFLISLEQDNSVELFPNPTTNDRFHVHIDMNVYEGEAIVEIHDMQGREVYLKEIDEQDFEVDFSHLNIKPGSYIVEIEVGENVFYEHLIIR